MMRIARFRARRLSTFFSTLAVSATPSAAVGSSISTSLVAQCVARASKRRPGVRSTGAGGGVCVSRQAKRSSITNKIVGPTETCQAAIVFSAEAGKAAGKTRAMTICAATSATTSQWKARATGS